MALNSVSTVTTANSQAGQINQQDFLKILLSQLNAQNPLKPMDNTAFVAQLAQFSQLAQTQEMSTSIKQLLSVQTATQTLGLLGRTVGVLNGSSITSGQVTDVSVIGNAPVLTVHPTAGADMTGVALKQIMNIN
jgi:flagellar basal-body rod modification protein FlgD